MTLADKRILLIIGGGIAAYKGLDLIRRLRERGAKVTPVMTRAAAEFVTPLSVGVLAGTKVYGELFDRDDEQDVGHIRLARGADLVILAPASATRMGKMAAGIGDDLAGAILLATRAPVLLAPAMNPAMWTHPATRRSLETLKGDGLHFVGPNRGEMAESGESGEGRIAEPLEIVAAAEAILGTGAGPLAGRHILVTSGPTHEPIDPVRYIANRSSGRQGHAIAASLARLGARVTLVSGPVALADPPDVSTVHVETAREMLAAVEAALPADAAVFVAAVADWRMEGDAAHKIKKGPEGPPSLHLVENPDILRTVGIGPRRPALVVGFAAETRDLLENAAAKLERKGADLIVANDVSGDVMGGEANTVRLVSRDGVEEWPRMPKGAVADRLALDIARRLAETGRP
ncbi:bifunctional phosphopantothenoylcysteine decarboxylase/phosphopantothenate--cysteine ligase CoaBC [Aureimonas phyllosphaerae]|uniref:Coenzyme A biosynthesis bifunctional protein CoaBC n=1 Tax=Aureimonas phyllosphaerae TaxID=1166078 RepID=A0A7W6FW49_9HYPH|nr:bifunctional phosphopantothenoylcysteine decarboxylase/phosphopantothenate--cysteine ligase CoaBC [Aureimonas phyllosphaerae]MBB3937515.1 phosphopantothenoylcysteine decarboxylase/phosphopantothenate--cysteine ligase [Aureimonas phyllosphaerae]MBB3961419.1 phosphopantothenoylcysteine decarboxylase/phosphopantothenate--cysteine ligase [Aureimonas phyllosphaerae]SFF37938.1 Phosphopantothenate-cysteine ligase /Phosphopantothenoylcysteine decarboxylase [Aureimonas phyllosphaerae]